MSSNNALLQNIPPNPDCLSHEPVAQLYNHNHGWLRGWLHQRMGCHEVAADLAQDTFVRLLNKPQSLQQSFISRRYLRIVADGLCVDLWRRKSIERSWLETLALRPQEVDVSPEDRAVVIETLCEIDDMLSRLQVNVTRAFIWSQIDGLSYKQIALRLGVSDRMVKKYMAKAMLECVLIEAKFSDSEANNRASLKQSV